MMRSTDESDGCACIYLHLFLLVESFGSQVFFFLGLARLGLWS